MQNNFDEKFASFFQGVTKLLNEHQNQVNFFREISVEHGRRYAKVVVGGAAFCFIDRTNGDVLKSASWRAPAKHARGNIFDAHNGLRYITPYGVAYLR